MASKKDTYEKEIVEIIKKHNLFVIQDIFAFYTGIKSSQFYNLELEKSEKIKEAIDNNKVKTCQSLKNKWFKSDNATLNIALFKTICTDAEREKIAVNYNKNDNNNTELQPKIITRDDETNEALTEFIDNDA